MRVRLHVCALLVQSYIRISLISEATEIECIHITVSIESAAAQTAYMHVDEMVVKIQVSSRRKNRGLKWACSFDYAPINGFPATDIMLLLW